MPVSSHFTNSYDYDNPNDPQFMGTGLTPEGSLYAIFYGGVALGGGKCYYYFTQEECEHQVKLYTERGSDSAEFEKAIKEIKKYQN